jgi:dethiobiotin synthetase/adenosylmethionine--8-amino-7-oxononanoate aminotransferase
MAGGRKWSPTSAAFDAGSSIECCTLYAWQQAVSPHLAVEREGRPVSDEAVQRTIEAELGVATSANCEFVLVETAGGVASPAPSGTLQCDLFAPLQLPAILVGDGGLGGISATICAY